MSTCRRCHRSIRDSWAISPACLKRERLAAMERAGEGYSQAIRDKAAALLTSKGVQHETGGLYRVRPSGDGDWLPGHLVDVQLPCWRAGTALLPRSRRGHVRGGTPGRRSYRSV